METNTRRIVRLIVSALASGLIAAGGVILVSAPDGDMTPGQWLITGVVGVTALCKDVQSSLSTPPDHVLPRHPPAGR